MSLSPWLTVALAIPVLLLGEWMICRLPLLSRFNIPAPVVGGLLVSLILLAGNLTGLWPAHFESKIAAQWWTWLVTIEPEWIHAPAKNANLPFLVAFFTCIGLNASWSLVKRGSVQVLIFLILSTGLAVVQNLLGVGLAKLMGAPPLLGLVCGSITLIGGHGTALGFAGELEKAGLPGAAVVGVAAATFGLVAGGLLGGPVGGGLIRKHALKSAAPALPHIGTEESTAPGILTDLRAMVRGGVDAGVHLVVVLVCIKIGAWVSYLIQQSGITFPVYMGAMLVGLAVRNGLDLAGKPWIQTERIDLVASLALGLFLSMAMMSLNLIELAEAALPMLVILAMQTVIMAFFAWFVTFRAMGRDFDAAVMAGGQCGFGLGATSNAVASMKVLVEKFGPAPRAFLVVPIVGAFLIDLVNAVNITAFLNLLKP